jgi:hypothetical protein
MSMNHNPQGTAQTVEDDELFIIGRGIGPVGRWVRLLLGIDFLVFLVVNPLYLHPVARGALPAFAASVAAYVLVIVVAYVVVFALFGGSILSKLNPWAGTGIFLGIPTVLALLGVLPQTVQVAFGLYIGVGLVLLFFMRYGGCEVVALPSLILKRRVTLYCPLNAIDAIERAVTPDKNRTEHRLLTMLSMAIVTTVGGYFILVKWNDLLGQYGIASHIDDRWSLLLLIPCVQLAVLALKHYRVQRSFFAPMVRKYALGAVILVLAVVVSLFPGHGVDNALFMGAMGLGVIFGLFQVGARLVRRGGLQRGAATAGSQVPAKRG